MNKRVLSLLLALVMAFSLCVPAFAADEFEAEAPAVQEEVLAAPVAEEPESPAEEIVPVEPEEIEASAPVAEETAEIDLDAAGEVYTVENNTQWDWLCERLNNGLYHLTTIKVDTELEVDKTLTVGFRFLTLEFGPSGKLTFTGGAGITIQNPVYPLTVKGTSAQLAGLTSGYLVHHKDADNYTYHNEMPELVAAEDAPDTTDKVIKCAEGKEYKVYTVVCTVPGYGNFIADPDYTIEGETVTLDIEPFDGYKCEFVTVTGYESGKSYDLNADGKSFVMPGESVLVDGKFVKDETGGTPTPEPTPTPIPGVGGECGENVTWSLSEDGTLTISGTGPMKNYSPYDDGVTHREFAPWADFESDDPLNESITKIVIGSGVTTIGDFAFYCCYYAESVTIPDTVTSIGDYAFESCGLTSVTIPGSVTSIGVDAFDHCNSLASVTIGEGVETIGSWAFGWCQELTRVDIPSSVTVIYDGAFFQCRFMTDITIRNPQCEIAKASDPDAIDHMGLVFSSRVVTIHGYAGSTAEKYVEEQNKLAAEDEYFDGTLPYAFVVIGEEEPEPAPSTSGECGENVTWSLSEDGTLTIAGSGAMDDYESDGDAPWAQSRELFRSIKKVVVESGVTHIGEFAFYDCTTVVSAAIAGTVEEIGLNAFGSCTGLESVTIDDGVTSIGDNAFMLCDRLKSVDVPASVTYIGVAAFARCSDLTDITIRNPECELERALAESSHVVTIHGYAGSTAEKYVEEQNKEAEQYGGIPGYKFAPLSEETPEVIKEHLKGSIANAEALNEADYTAESWAAVAEALAAAKAVVADETATQDEVDAAYGALETAMACLVQAEPAPEADKTVLAEDIALAEDMAEYKDDFTEASWAALEAALESAKAVYDKKDATQAEVDEAVKALGAAMKALVGAPADKTALNAAITAAEALKEADYTAESWAPFAETLASAKAVAADENAFKSEVAGALAALTEAQAALVKAAIEPAIPAAPKSGTGWVENEDGDIYFYKDNQLKKGFWVGKTDGASKWDGNWYYVGADGKLATGMQYIDDLHGGYGWYYLQPTNKNGEIGKMLTGWQWVGVQDGTNYGTCYFSAKSGESGKCTYSSELGDWNGNRWVKK